MSYNDDYSSKCSWIYLKKRFLFHMNLANFWGMGEGDVLIRVQSI